MHNDLEVIREMAQFLAVQSETHRKPLLEASARLWAAVYEGEPLSPELEGKARDLARKVKRIRGEAVRNLDDRVASSLSEGIIDLSERLPLRAPAPA